MSGHRRPDTLSARPGGGPPRHGPMAMAGPVEKANNFKAAFRRLLKRLAVERVWIGIVIVLSLTSVGFSVAGPKLLGNATDVLFEGVIGRSLPATSTKSEAVETLRADGNDRFANMVESMDVVPGQGISIDRLRDVLILVAFVYLASSLFAWLQNWIMAGVTQRVVYRLRRDVDKKLAKLPLKYFDTTNRGDLLSRLTNDIENINSTLQHSLTQAITSLATVIGVLSIMVWISPTLAFIALVSVPVSIAVTFMIAKRAQPSYKKQWKNTGVLNGHVEEMFTGHDLVKLFGHQQAAQQKFDDTNNKIYRASARAQFISGITMPAMSLIGNLSYVVIAVVGGLRVANGTLSLGSVQAFVQYSRQFTMPITQLASLSNMVQSAIASAERVFDILDAEEELPDMVGGSTGEPMDAADVPRDILPQEVLGHIEFDNVSFRYRPDTPLIDGLNIDVQPGQTVAIVGPTGAGKTTLVNLLMRFYELDGGQIRLDGVSLADLPRDVVRQQFAMVLQDTWVFGGTIAENIAYGAVDASDEQVRAAAQTAHADHFIRTLPGGYDTVLTDDATSLSAGEKQLITIARAVLSQAPILILDEATSSVDTRTELLIQEAMGRLRSGRTSFVIAHRLSTIRDADVILVMRDGSAVEQGSHDVLMARKGVYYELFTSQYT